MKTAIVYDSGTTISKEIAKEIDAYELKMMVHVTGTSQVIDSTEVSLQRIANATETKESFKTSMTPTGVMLDLFEKLSEEYDQILFFPVMKSLSSQMQQGMAMQKQFPKLRVYDTDDAMYSQGLLLQEVRALLNNGKTPDEINDFVQQRKTRFNCYVGFDRIEGLIASGRGSKTLGSIAKFLKLKLLISMKETIDKIGISTKLETIMDKMITLMGNSLNITAPHQIKNLIIYNGECEPKIIDLFISKVKKFFDYDKAIVTQIPSVMLIHSRKNSFAIFLEKVNNL